MELLGENMRKGASKWITIFRSSTLTSVAGTSMTTLRSGLDGGSLTKSHSLCQIKQITHVGDVRVEVIGEAEEMR